MSEADVSRGTMHALLDQVFRVPPSSSVMPPDVPVSDHSALRVEVDVSQPALRWMHADTAAWSRLVMSPWLRRKGTFTFSHRGALFQNPQEHRFAATWREMSAFVGGTQRGRYWGAPEQERQWCHLIGAAVHDPHPPLLWNDHTYAASFGPVRQALQQRGVRTYVQRLDVGEPQFWLHTASRLLPYFQRMYFLSTLESGFPLPMLYLVLSGRPDDHDLADSEAFDPDGPPLSVVRAGVHAAFVKTAQRFHQRVERNVLRHEWLQYFPQKDSRHFVSREEAYDPEQPALTNNNPSLGSVMFQWSGKIDEAPDVLYQPSQESLSPTYTCPLSPNEEDAPVAASAWSPVTNVSC